MKETTMRPVDADRLKASIQTGIEDKTLMGTSRSKGFIVNLMSEIYSIIDAAPTLTDEERKDK